MPSLKSKISEFYQKHESQVDIAFFLGGFLFDVLTLGEIDDTFAIIQQVVYLLLIGWILYVDLIGQNRALQIPSRLQKAWEFRHLALHFMLGSLLSIYSLFFLKSSSIFSSIVFVLFLMALMVANELKVVKESQLNVKMGLFVVCVFSFLSTLVPVLFGFVGIFPFLVTLILSAGVMGGIFWLVQRQKFTMAARQQVLYPSSLILVVLLVFYLVGFLPPVPLSIKKMGVYHNIQKQEGHYILKFERPWWKFWQSGAQDFVAEPGDRIYFFASVYSPAKFDDSVVLHWSYLERQAWKTTDKIPMRISGGRKEGFRGFATKERLTDGRWKVSVETTDGREIGRLYFRIQRTDTFNPEREFHTEVY